MQRRFGLSAVAALVLSASCFAVSAAPIAIDFDFSPITVTFNGSLQSTGQFQVHVVTDTTTPNVGSGFSDFTNFYAVNVYWTAPALGLSGARVTSPTYLFFGTDVIGITAVTDGDFATLLSA